jgi:trehalose 6-phosphate phosphatase
VGELPDVMLVAEHGNDMGAELAPHQDVERLAHDVTHLARSLPGSMVEAKRSSVVFHYRNANATDLDEHLSKVLDLATRWPAATVIAGKKVIELSLGTRTKGDAISELATEAAGVLYIGDDTTDETVFESLGPDDIGVKVGEGETAAGFRVQGVEDVVELLVTLQNSIEGG